MLIDIFGTYPPPIGGTSIHIQRLVAECINHGLSVRVFDTMGNVRGKKDELSYVTHIKDYKRFLLKYLKDRSASIVHSHSHSWIERAILTWIAKMKRQKIIFTFHSLREELNKLTRQQRLAVKYVFKNSDVLVATNEQIKEKLENWGCSGSKIVVISPFIKPQIDTHSEMDEEIHNFAHNFEFYICANASNNEHYQGTDLYGLDMCIELQKRLSERYNCGFVYVLTKVTDDQYLDEMFERIKDYGIQESFLLISHPVDFLSVISHSKLFVRTTCSDARALSVDESIALGIPAIASDVCWHPNSCILFEPRNMEMLMEKTIYVLSHYEAIKDRVLHDTIEDSSDAIISLYNKLEGK